MNLLKKFNLNFEYIQMRALDLNIKDVALYKAFFNKLINILSNNKLVTI